jgi:hypothetical protein
MIPSLALVPAARADEGLVTLITDTESLSGYQRQVLEYNLRIQRQNNAPAGFPSFIRDKFDIAIVADGYQQSPEGMILRVPAICAHRMALAFKLAHLTILLKLKDELELLEFQGADHVHLVCRCDLQRLQAGAGSGAY